MTTPRDALFVDALSGSDGTAEVAPAPWSDERFGDPLAESVVEPRGSVVPVVSLPVVQLAPPDPRQWMSHLAEQAAQEPSAPRHPQTPPGVQYAAQPGAPSYVAGAWPPPAIPGPPARAAGQRLAPRQSSAPRRPAAPQRAAGTQRPAPQRRPAAPPTQPAVRKKSGGGWAALFVLIIFLVFSGLGQRVVDAVLEILNR